MTPGLLAVTVVVVYGLACIAYVYRWRGRTRYERLAQYLRKSWPVFAPLNCLMYMATRSWARRPVLDADYLENVDLLRADWRVIRALKLALNTMLLCVGLGLVFAVGSLVCGLFG